jgi:tetratricopeptide (TPR) repeat protein
MNRTLEGKRPTFRPGRSKTNFYRVLVLLGLILGSIWLLMALRRGEVKSPFEPTPTPTRMAESYFMEAKAYFDAGKLDDPTNNMPGGLLPESILATATAMGTSFPEDSTVTPALPTPNGPVINDAIDAYRAALEADPNNGQAWAELARIQAYSSQTLRNDTEKLTRLEEALESAENAVSLAPDDSTVRAIRAFVLDWYAYNSLVDAETSAERLVEAEREASRAFQLDPNNALALAYYAEILADRQKLTQAEKYASQAVKLGPQFMDTHRVYAYVWESLGQYRQAIEEYLEATRISPNLAFLYILIGQNYREGIKNPDQALEYFDRAAKINAQLGVQNPLPYIEIAKTYTQQGQFLIAGANAEKALSFDNTNANTYGQLGIIFRRARNYEGANSLLKCAVRGCTADENEMGKADVDGLPLSGLTIAYYYVEYGTNLAFLSRPNENYCAEAVKVLEEVRAYRPDDTTLVSIINDSEGICRRLAGEIATATARPTSTPTPLATPTSPQ